MLPLVVGVGLPGGVGFGLVRPLPLVEVGEGAAVDRTATGEVVRAAVPAGIGGGAVRVGTSDGVAPAGLSVPVVLVAPPVEPAPAGRPSATDGASQPSPEGAGKTPAIAWSRQLWPPQRATPTEARTANAARAAATAR